GDGACHGGRPLQRSFHMRASLPFPAMSFSVIPDDGKAVTLTVPRQAGKHRAGCLIKRRYCDGKRAAIPIAAFSREIHPYRHQRAGGVRSSSAVRPCAASLWY
ncbi:MAG: hypothetical protein ACLQI7_31050, partial [Streptosporangiaceae bacterium]